MQCRNVILNDRQDRQIDRTGIKRAREGASGLVSYKASAMQHRCCHPMPSCVIEMSEVSCITYASAQKNYYMASY